MACPLFWCRPGSFFIWNSYPCSSHHVPIPHGGSAYRNNSVVGVCQLRYFPQFSSAHFTAIAIVSRFRKDLAFAMLGWPFHIVLDFPFHTREFFPSKIFWPLWDFTVDGISWGQPKVWLPNLAGLILLYSYRRGLWTMRKNDPI